MINWTSTFQNKKVIFKQYYISQCLLSILQSIMLTSSMHLIMPLMIILYVTSDQCSGQPTMDNDGGYSCNTCIIGGRRGRSLCRGCVQGASDAQFSCRRCSPGSDPSSYDCRGCTNNNPEFGEHYKICGMIY